jgi:hypothetical protein
LHDNEEIKIGGEVRKLTADETFGLGNLIRDAAIALGDWRVQNRSRLSRLQWDELDDKEITLLNLASAIYISAIGMVLDDSHTPLSRLQSSVKHAKSAMQRIKVFKQALDLALGLVLLAGAVASGNVAEIPVAVVALEDAAGAIVNPGGSNDN